MRTLYDNAPLKEALAEAGLPVREFFTFTTERGDELNGYMLKPLDFDPAKRYPVLLTQYSGPGSQQVAEGWGPDWEDALVTHGYIVVCVDPGAPDIGVKSSRNSLTATSADWRSKTRFRLPATWPVRAGSIQRESASTAGRTEVSWPWDALSGAKACSKWRSL